MKKLGELLVEQGKLSERDVERTLLAQLEMGGLFGQVLVKLGLVSEQDVAQVLSRQLDVPLLLPSDYPEEPIHLHGLAQTRLKLLQRRLLSRAADRALIGGEVQHCRRAWPQGLQPRRIDRARLH